MEIRVRAVLEAEIDNIELARAVFYKAREIGGLLSIDDGGGDWYTDDEGNTYIANDQWKVSSNPQVAAMIDTYYALLGAKFRSYKRRNAAQQDTDETA